MSSSPFCCSATPKVVVPSLSNRSKTIEEESARVLALAADTFKEDGGWNSSIIDVKVDLLEEEDGCIYRCEVTAIVKVQLVAKSSKFHEDIGCGIAENTFKPYAVECAKKEAITDARTRALKLLIADKNSGKHQATLSNETTVAFLNTHIKEENPTTKKASESFAIASSYSSSSPPQSGAHTTSNVNVSCGLTTTNANNTNNNTAVAATTACDTKKSTGWNENENDDDEDETLFLANLSDDDILRNCSMLPSTESAPAAVVTAFANENPPVTQNVIPQQQQQQRFPVQVDGPTQPPKRPTHTVVVANPPKKPK